MEDKEINDEGPEVFVLTREYLDVSLDSCVASLSDQINKMQGEHKSLLHDRVLYEQAIDTALAEWRASFENQDLEPGVNEKLNDIQSVLAKVLRDGGDAYVEAVSKGHFDKEMHFIREEMDRYFSVNRMNEKGNIYHHYKSFKFLENLDLSTRFDLKIQGIFLFLIKQFSFISITVVAGSFVAVSLYYLINTEGPRLLIAAADKWYEDIDSRREDLISQLEDTIKKSTEKEISLHFDDKGNVFTTAVETVVSAGRVIGAVDENLLESTALVTEVKGQIGKITDVNESINNINANVDRANDGIGQAIDGIQSIYEVITQPHPFEGIIKAIYELSGTVWDVKTTVDETNVKVKKIPEQILSAQKAIELQLGTLASAIDELPLPRTSGPGGYDVPKNRDTIESVGVAVKLAQDIQVILSPDNKDHFIAETIDVDGARVGFFKFSSSYFESGKFAPTRVLRKNADRIGMLALNLDWRDQDNTKGFKVVVIGHSDEDAYTHFGRDNCWLSKQRAAWFTDIMLLGEAPPGRIFLYGRSDYDRVSLKKPQNRRIEVFFSRNEDALKKAIKGRVEAANAANKQNQNTDSMLFPKFCEEQEPSLMEQNAKNKGG